MNIQTLELLETLKEYFEDKADADYRDERYVPNKEMRLLNDINEAIENEIRNSPGKHRPVL